MRKIGIRKPLQDNQFQFRKRCTGLNVSGKVEIPVSGEDCPRAKIGAWKSLQDNRFQFRKRRTGLNVSGEFGNKKQDPYACLKHDQNSWIIKEALT